MGHKLPKGVITQPQLKVGPVQNLKALTALLANNSKPEQTM